MPIKNLDKIFAPNSVVVIGGSPRAGSVGQTVLRNLRNGFRGNIYAVNPKYRDIAGTPSFPSILEIGEPVDLAVICTPAPYGAGDRGGVRRGGDSRGGDPLRRVPRNGRTGEALEAGRAGSQARNSTACGSWARTAWGIMSPHVGPERQFRRRSTPPKGHVAFISQSGALCTSVLDWAHPGEHRFLATSCRSATCWTSGWPT